MIARAMAALVPLVSVTVELVDGSEPLEIEDNSRQSVAFGDRRELKCLRVTLN